MIRFFAFLILASAPFFFADARPESAPGIKKKSLDIFNVAIVRSGTNATITWETNFRAGGAVDVEDYSIAEGAPGIRHTVTIPFLIPGLPYAFRIVSFSDIYGSATPYEGTFTL